MYSIIPYLDEYKAQYCYLFSATWMGEPYGEIFTEEEILKSLNENKNFLYILLGNENDEIMGFVGGRPLADNCSFFLNESITPISFQSAFYISELVVAEKQRRCGWAHPLTLFLVSAARVQGYNQFVLRTHSDPNNPAQRLYRKLGFETRNILDGNLHGIITEQSRIDSRPTSDFRIYFYKEY